MTNNCPGVPHRPGDPAYRAAVERHIRHGGSIQQRPVERDHWSMPYTPFAGALIWGIDEYRPAEPLRTDGYPQGVPDPGGGWRLLLAGETASEKHGDGMWHPGHQDWFAVVGDWEVFGSSAVRRRIINTNDPPTLMSLVGLWKDDPVNLDWLDSDTCDRIERMESIVKRLAAFNLPLLETEQYEVNQIIQEAKELTDE